MIYYIADIHFGDLRVFNKCSKPFKNLNEYEIEIVKQWTKKVSNDDTVYVLGDISDGIYLKSIDLIRNLPGKKNLIIGNHDLPILDKIKKSGVFDTIEFMGLIEDNGRKVCLCHYPVMDWMEFSRGGYLVYGHIHNKTGFNNKAYPQIKEYFKDKLGYNAGVDVTNYEPVTLDEMIKLKRDNKDEPYIN